jgi:hypothetical protein
MTVNKYRRKCEILTAQTTKSLLDLEVKAMNLKLKEIEKYLLVYNRSSSFTLFIY